MKTLNTLTLTAATMLLAGSFSGTADAGHGNSYQRDRYCGPSYGYCPPRCEPPYQGGPVHEGIVEGTPGFGEGIGAETPGFGEGEGFAEESDLGALEGLWQAVSTDANGQPQQIHMNVLPDATAQLTVPTGPGGYQTITGSVSVTSGQLLLDCNGRNISLGQVVSANASLVVLKNGGGNIIFRRP